MKGFKKDGKFHPTEKRTKSSLKKTDVKNAKDNSLDMSKQFELIKKKEKETGKSARNSIHSDEDRNKQSLLSDENQKKQIKNIRTLMKEIHKNWEPERYFGGVEGGTTIDATLKDLSDDEGKDFGYTFTNREDGDLTFELHYNEYEMEPDPPDHPKTEYFDEWYWFPARNGKGIWNSPSGEGEGGGYTVFDAFEMFLEDIVRWDKGEDRR